MARYRLIINGLIGSFLMLAVLLVLWPQTTAADAHPTFKQQILPLNCVFEIVNDGTNTLRYLTPAECGVLVPGPALTSATTAPSQAATLPTTNSKAAFNRGYSLAPPDSSGTINGPPWQPIVSNLKSHQAKGLSPTTGTATVAALAVFICLVIMAIVVL